MIAPDYYANLVEFTTWQESTSLVNMYLQGTLCGLRYTTLMFLNRFNQSQGTVILCIPSDTFHAAQFRGGLSAQGPVDPMH